MADKDNTATDTFKFTVVTKTNGILTKKCGKDDTGKFFKDGSECRMTRGTGQVIEITLKYLPNIIEDLKHNQAIVHGIPKDNKLNIPNLNFNIESEKNFKGQPNTTTRTKDAFDYPKDSNRLFMVDYDPPKDKSFKPLSLDNIIDAISSVLDGYKEAAKLITYSTSSCISDDNGQVMTDKGAGCHIYSLMPPDTDMERFKTIFKTRAWLKGFGHIKISKAGSLLERNLLFDEFVLSPERLDFVSGAVIPDGWTQSRPEPVYIDGNIYNPSLLPDLTEDETTTYKQMVKEAKDALKPDADKIKALWITVKGKELFEQRTAKDPSDNITIEQCEDTFLKATDNGDLYADFELYFDELNGQAVTVAEVLKDKESLKYYDKMTLADPLETDAGRCKAIFYSNIGKGKEKPVIHSFNHGEHKYFLHNQQPPLDDAAKLNNSIDSITAFQEWLDSVSLDKGNIGNTDKINTIILASWTKKIIELDIDDIQAQNCMLKVHEITKIGKIPLKNELKKVTEKRQSEKRKEQKLEKLKAQKEEKAKHEDYLKQRYNIIPLPEIIHINHLTGKTIEAISKALGEYQGDNPIYRFGSDIVCIRNSRPSTVRMALKLHNAKHDYPVMPIIKHLSPDSLRTEVEKVCVVKTLTGEDKDTGEPQYENIMTPLHILKGLMTTPDPYERNLTGIIEHPYIDDDFNPVFQYGYDHRTGLVQYFKPKKHDFNFKNEITYQQITKAIEYLCNDVMRDFPFAEQVDLYGAIACLLTGMQRKMINGLTGCPGFLFDAPMQGTGKTTLAQLISYSLYNRPAAASSYSDKDEEMAKHLLSILREGHSYILFDNLQEGMQLENNELAKAMTNTTYTNRVLGTNRTETYPSQVLWTFSGNNIALCGDFKTRVLPIRLDAKTADPDRRKFIRKDIGKWCEENREKILYACMTLLIGSKISDADAASIEPSRFSDWDRFVRFPIISATDGRIDIMDLFERNKKADTKTEGQINFLEAWINLFGSTPTTSKQALKKAEQTNIGYDFNSSIDDFKEAVLDIFNGSMPRSKGLSNWLSGLKGRIINGYRIDSYRGTAREVFNKQCWIVKKIDDNQNSK